MTPSNAVLSAWFGAEQVTLAPLGAGHINATFEVRAAAGRWVLQAISPHVFSTPRAVIDNLARLSVGCDGAADWSYATPRLVPTRSGDDYLQHGGRYWRLCDYIGPARTVQRLVQPAMARSAARAFAQLQTTLAALPADALVPTLPGFHDLVGYLAGLTRTLEQAGADARQGAGELLDELFQRRSLYRDLPALAPSYIHGDCKVNNLRFALDTSDVVGVLDLDTVMLGQWWWDFGDLVRSAAVGSATAHGLDPATFDALVAGFFAEREPLDEQALALALIAPAFMSYMLCVRFLTDHLAGDKYFRVTERGENLDRAQEQFALLLRFESAESQALRRRSLAAFAAGA